jgi:trypsin
MTRRLLATVLAIGAGAALCAPAGAVVNGTKIDASTVPWYTSVGSCGATFVTPSRLLTAAHCVRNRTPADLGGIARGGQTRMYTHFAMAPTWRHANGSGNYIDDVAIVELSAPLDGVTTVKLGGAEPAEAWIMGQGRPFAPGSGHSEAEQFDSSLRIAPLKSLTDAQCAAAFKGYKPSAGEHYDARMRCSIDGEGKAPLYSGCNGDSGGPLWTGTPAAPVQLGVVSWGGDRCGADHLPSVFADVARYRDFILDPTPTWAPTRTGKAKVRGTAKPGRKLTCSVPGYQPETAAKVAYEWRELPKGGNFASDGTLRRQKVLGKGTTYKLKRGDRGSRVACFVTASNDGGQVAVGVANVLVKG